MLDRCDLESGSRQLWYQSLTACRISKPTRSKLSLEFFSYVRELIVEANMLLLHSLLGLVDQSHTPV